MRVEALSLAVHTRDEGVEAMASGREQHEGLVSKLSALAAPAGKLVDEATSAPGEPVDEGASAARGGASQTGHLRAR
jgi:hypothetical protein